MDLERIVTYTENGLGNVLLRGGSVSPGHRVLATGRAGSQRSVTGFWGPSCRL